MKKNFSLFSLLVVILLSVSLWGCSGESYKFSEKEPSEDTASTKMEFEYATQLAIDRYEDGIYSIHIEDGLNYILVPEGGSVPDWIGEEISEYTIIRQPLDSTYIAASSAVDIIDAIGAISHVNMTSTKANDWGIDKIRELVELEDILYVGKYSAPDYEALLENGCELAVESTMIYHSPEIKEAIESLGIPVLVERSSYETHPLGRLEWIKLYGLLFGMEEEAADFFDDTTQRLSKILDETNKMHGEERPKVAFFSISGNGYATVRKPGDYICQMIEMAGGEYAMNDLAISDENALSTTNIQLESFYEYAVNSDIIIYNSAIQEELYSMDDLTDKFQELRNCKAVKDGNVWCTGKNVFQKTSGICEMTEELYLIISGEAKDLEYFHRLI